MTDVPRDPITRRAVVASLAGAAGAAALAAAGIAGGTPSADSGAHPQAHDQRRMPVVFLPHGGGPWPFVQTGIGTQAELDALALYLRSLAALPPKRPTALLVVSAHWEEGVPTVMTAARPPMLYDYFGFPPASYEVTWPAPGAPDLGPRVLGLLERAGIPGRADPARGFDHGTFVPLKLAWPDADIPTLQLSLKRGLDPTEHLVIGRALAPLRDEGVLIVGSGMTFHNLRAFGDPRARPIAEDFDAWLRDAMIRTAGEREQRLVAWEQAPRARLAHPREEHLLPLHVVAGAAGQDLATLAFDGTILGLRLSAFHFG